MVKYNHEVTVIDISYLPDAAPPLESCSLLNEAGYTNRRKKMNKADCQRLSNCTCMRFEHLNDFLSKAIKNDPSYFGHIHYRHT